MEKILYLISSIKNDGPNKVLKSLVDGTIKEKYQIILLSFLNTNDELCVNYYRNLNIRVINLNYNNKRKIITDGVKEIKKICVDEDIDIIHSHGILPDIASIKCKTNKKIAKITTIHNNMFEDYIYTFGRLKGSFFIRWHLYYLKQMNCCVCCSKYVFDSMKNSLKNIVAIQNSIYDKTTIYDYEEKRKNIRKKYNIQNNSIVYVYSGCLNERKNVKQLVLQMNKYMGSNEYLFVLGTGSLLNELKNNNTNANIIFCGFVNNVLDYYCASDVYVSFSKSEGFSISILEALEYNNLLLVSNIPSHSEIFDVDKEIYIGEVFSNDTFNEKKQKVMQHIINKGYNPKLLLQKHLNIFELSKQYINIYEYYDKQM